MKASFFLLTALVALVHAECPVYIANSNDMIHIDAEQRGEGGGWEFRPAADTPDTPLTNYLGSGYLTYKQWSNFGGTEHRPTNFRDDRIKTYYFTVNTPGVYRVMLRSSAPDPTEHNDLWMSLPESGAMRTTTGGNTSEIFPAIAADQMNADWVDPNIWFKVYQNNGNDVWNTGGYTTDFDPHTILTKPLLADQTWYSVRIAGRSTQFKVDRIILFRCEDTECAYSGLRYGVAKAYAGPQSECGGH